MKKVELIYNQNYKGTNGQVAKSSRLAFAALFTQIRLVITDEETAEQIQENPSVHYFYGFDSYTPVNFNVVCKKSGETT